MTVQASPDKSISDELESILGQLTTDQIRFLIARAEFNTDKEAAESIKMKPDTIYHWKSRQGAPLEEARRLMAGDGLVVAQHLRRRHLGKAMAVKVAGLDSGDERVRQNVATEVIEWEMGKAAQPTEMRGKVTVEREPPDFSALTDEELDAYIAICERLQVSTERSPEA